MLVSFVGSVSAHEVKQLLFTLKKAGEEWAIESTFDAAYALPELRAFKEASQPDREWLFTLSDDEHARLRRETEKYIRESVSLLHGGKVVDYKVSFPDYASSPPDFPKLLNGGAYMRVVMSGRLNEGAGGEFVMRIEEGERPDFVVGLGKDNYVVIKPGDEARLFKTHAKSPEVEIRKAGLWGVLVMGYQHVIPEGVDHLLFILGLFLMARKWHALLSQSLAFTLAHSVTLGLASMEVIHLSQWSLAWMIEPMIALSIAVVAFENIWLKEGGRHRVVMVFFFGLIHGLGFAGSLGTALDRSGAGSLSALAVANLGVELAQVTILASAWILTLYWWKKPVYERFRIAASLTIGVIGLVWFVQRV